MFCVYMWVLSVFLLIKIRSSPFLVMLISESMTLFTHQTTTLMPKAKKKFSEEQLSKMIINCKKLINRKLMEYRRKLKYKTLPAYTATRSLTFRTSLEKTISVMALVIPYGVSNTVRY